ncbi:MAG: GNAT family N-acetyltransferase [Phycisphaerae bacterium]|nr:GNAT family N-acetyltransferase [Phycisphaerae bacterium]
MFDNREQLNSVKSILETTSGYLHPQYAASLAEFGVPRELPRSGGWILERSIPGTAFQDAMGCYPLFACHDWSQLAGDLEDLAEDLVSLSVVTDPFGEYDEALLKECFPDKVVPFKEHFYVDLEPPLEEYVESKHRRKARKALEQLHVEQCENAAAVREDWVRLYGHLIERHGITGIRAFSSTVFAGQFQVPGFVALRASCQDLTAGMALLYVQEPVAYYHLTAYSPLGYEMDASFALFWRVIEYCRGRGLKWLDLGAGAGMSADGQDGLTRFKRGWSTGTRSVYFCGRIFDRETYDQIVKSRGAQDTVYFPAYRSGEFA